MDSPFPLLWRKNYSWEALFLGAFLGVGGRGLIFNKESGSTPAPIGLKTICGLSFTWLCSTGLQWPTWHGRSDTPEHTSCLAGRSGTRWQSRCSRQFRLPGGRKMSTGKHPSFWNFFFHLRVFAVCFVAAIFLPVLWWDQLKNFRLKKELLENLTWNDVLPGIPDHEPGSSPWVPWVANAHIQFGQALTWTIVLCRLCRNSKFLRTLWIAASSS